jgi:FtsP/CotA-like multicopper oxidase with cupredoxin domain
MWNIFLSLGLLAASFIPVVFGSPTLEKSYENCTKTVIFPVTLTWETGAPDGFERKMIFTNGQFPGPLLSIEEGDNVEVRRIQIN